MDSASSRTLGTTKLLEFILLHLPTHWILLAQRVSRSRKAVIDTSVLIQTALCFRPTIYTTTKPSDTPIPGRPDFFTAQSFLDTLAEKKPGAVYLNPLFKTMFPISQFLSEHSYYYTTKNAPSNFPPKINKDGVEHSWRSMYLTQPPVTRLQAPVAPDELILYYFALMDELVEDNDPPQKWVQADSI